MSHSRLLRLLLCATVCVALLAKACARSGIAERIVGGQPAIFLDVPYVVSILFNGNHICGGSIINRQTVLTAAHCLLYTTPNSLKVHAGTKTRSLSEGVIVRVEDIYIHELWTDETKDYDVGVIRLAQPLTYSSTIQPIRLEHRSTSVKDGTLALVVGWGRTSENGPESDILRYAKVPLINQRACSRLYKGDKYPKITSSMICAGYARGDIDACTYDSGGPLVVGTKQIGIVSWSEGCARPDKPGVYARVTEVFDWVEHLLADEYNEVL